MLAEPEPDFTNGARVVLLANVCHQQLGLILAPLLTIAGDHNTHLERI